MDFSDNPQMTLALDFIQETGTHVFLTGRAGTGKTTFLKGLKEICPKQLVVTAPTGVAAVNAGGVTLHSFFQLPFGPWIPGMETIRTDHRRFRFSKEKKTIIQGLDLLVIDEVSMVRADLLDAVDDALRRHRRNDQPFGGVQLLLIGDLFQLPPVARNEEWQVLQEHYSSVFFFASQALSRTRMVTIELDKIYRQSDPGFVGLLNQVRENRLDPDALGRLNQRVAQAPDQGTITLTTHNAQADRINQEKLSALPGPFSEFAAQISGEFPEHAFPTTGDLALKPGAQIMFLRNDPTPEKQYYNGKIGRVERISRDKVWVACPGEFDQIPVGPAEWQNITYTINEESHSIEENVIGRFTQFPLKPAWAVTIHKSQGLTFDRAVIDAGAAFAHGQVYVALSRCRSLDGLYLTAPLQARGIEMDRAVLDFTAGQHPPDPAVLASAKMAYQQELVLACFDFSGLARTFYYLASLLRRHAGVVQTPGLPNTGPVREILTEILDVAEKFRRQLTGIMAQGLLPDQDPALSRRTAKASAWFGEKLAQGFGTWPDQARVETDNKNLKRQITQALDTLAATVRTRTAAVLSCKSGFSPGGYLAAVSRASLTAGPGTRKEKPLAGYTELDIAHPEMFARLKAWRGAKAKAQGVAHFQVLHQKALVQIAVHLPEDMKTLKRIQGVGKRTIEKYGEDLLDLVNAYREEQGITELVLPEPSAAGAAGKETGGKPGKTTAGADTRQISLALFEKGMAPGQVAEERGLAISTIESHLCTFVETGDLAVDRLVSPENQAAIMAAIAPDKGLKDIREALDNEVSYGEIRAVMAHLKYRDGKKD